MRVERIAELGQAPSVLRALASATSQHGLPPPAALTGKWFGSPAVLVPSVAIEPVDVGDVFDAAPGSPGEAVGGGWIGYLSHPDAGADGHGPRIPEAAGGWTDDVLRQDGDGTWWYESLSGAAAPVWLAEALTADVARPPCHVAWGHADRDDHQAGVLACLDAIAAGEVYQACVCTQFVGQVSGVPVDFFAEAVARTPPARARSSRETGAPSPRSHPSCSFGASATGSTRAPSRARCRSTRRRRRCARRSRTSPRTS